MKTIDTLVQDIYDLFDKDSTVEFDQEKVEAFGKEVAETIVRRINEQRAGGTLRFSNLGTPCERKLWYEINQPESAEELPPEAKIKFLFGDILESMLLFLADAAGHKVEHRQKEVEISGVQGHIDAVIDGTLVDCKSASSFAFKKFASHGLESDDPFGYVDQLNSYFYALKSYDVECDNERFAFLVIDKQLGHICLDTYAPSGVDYKCRVEQKKEMVDGPIPKRSYFDEPDGKSGNRKLPTTCGYCSFKRNCWPGLRTFLYSNGPRYLTNVAKTPDVPEA